MSGAMAGLAVLESKVASLKRKAEELSAENPGAESAHWELPVLDCWDVYLFMGRDKFLKIPHTRASLKIFPLDSRDSYV